MVGVAMPGLAGFKAKVLPLICFYLDCGRCGVGLGHRVSW